MALLTRTANPRLNLYYGIFASAFASLVLLLALFEQLQLRQLWLSHILIIGSLVFYLYIALSARTLHLDDFFVAGRRVPSVFGGLALAATVIGGVGFFAVTGAVFFLGFDALVIGLGWVLGLLVALVLFVPYIRKSGAYTTPGFLGIRFASPTLRMAAALCLLPPVALLLTAEVKAAAFIMSLFVSVSYENALLISAGFVAIVVVLGGMRSVAWTQSVQIFVALAGFLVPAIIVSLMVTNLPLPQLTYGELFQRLATFEVLGGIVPGVPAAVSAALPGDVPMALTKPFLQPFGAFAWPDFIALLVCFALGTAAFPTILQRACLAQTAFKQRRAFAWATLLVALFVVTVPAYVAFVKYQVLQDLSTATADQMPQWFKGLEDAELAELADGATGAITAKSLLLAREGIALALPLTAGLPFVIAALVAAAGLAAALAAAAAQLFSLSASLSDDLYAVADRRASPNLRLLVARIAALLAAAGAAAAMTWSDLDLLQALFLAMSLASGTFFAPLLLAVWWRRTTPLGALAALLTGFALTAAPAALYLTGGTPFLGFDAMTAGALAAAAGLIVGIAVSLVAPRADASLDTFADDLRRVGGETLLDQLRRRRGASASAPPVA